MFVIGTFLEFFFFVVLHFLYFVPGLVLFQIRYIDDDRSIESTDYIYKE